MSKKKTQEELENSNPFDFTYEDGVKVEIEGSYLEELIRVTKTAVDEETKVFFPEQYTYVDEKGNEVSADTKGARMVPDAYATVANRNSVNYLTPLGQVALRAHMLLLETHSQAVKSGKAVSKKELKTKHQMKPVK